jgi:hypothetical protein
VHELASKHVQSVSLFFHLSPGYTPCHEENKQLDAYIAICLSPCFGICLIAHMISFTFSTRKTMSHQTKSGKRFSKEKEADKYHIAPRELKYPKENWGSRNNRSDRDRTRNRENNRENKLPPPPPLPINMEPAVRYDLDSPSPSPPPHSGPGNRCDSSTVVVPAQSSGVNIQEGVGQPAKLPPSVDISSKSKSVPPDNQDDGLEEEGGLPIPQVRQCHSINLCFIFAPSARVPLSCLLFV